MKCSKCGFEREEIFAFCPNCGQEATNDSYYVENVAVDPVSDLVLKGIKSPMFLAICILVSVGALAALGTGSIPILQILFSVFLWLTYAKARKNIADADQLRNISGTVYAGYVLSMVGAICALVGGGLVALCSVAVANINIEEIIEQSGFDSLIGFDLVVPEAAFGIGASFLVLILGVVIILASVIILLFNIFGLKTIHSFVKSVYISVGRCQPCFVKTAQAKNWLLVFGIFGIIGGVSTFFGGSAEGGIAELCYAATYILGSVIVNNLFFKETVQ